MIKKIKKGIENPVGASRHFQSKFAPFLTSAETSISSRYPIGQNVLEEDWDLLVVLDTCRYDALSDLRERFDYPVLNDGTLGMRTSVGGSTLEWTAQTFRTNYRSETEKIDYIAGNALVEEVLDGRRDPEDVDGAKWSLTSWSPLSKQNFNQFISVSGLRDVRSSNSGHEDRPHPSAQLVTDLAIRHGRENDPDQMIVHYIQPHYPYYSAIEDGKRSELNDWERFPFTALRTGSVSREEVWSRYMSELESGMDAVTDLLQNYDADKVVITADHGEAFGDRWLGLRGYKHRAGMLHPKVRHVPWLLTSSTDSKSRIPDIQTEEDKLTRDQRLNALGYI